MNKDIEEVLTKHNYKCENWVEYADQSMPAAKQFDRIMKKIIDETTEDISRIVLEARRDELNRVKHEVETMNGLELADAHKARLAELSKALDDGLSPAERMQELEENLRKCEAIEASMINDNTKSD